MQEELESSRPLLAQAAKDTEATIERIKVLLLGDLHFLTLTAQTALDTGWTGLAGIVHNRYLCRAALTNKTACCWGPALLLVSTSCCRSDGSHACLKTPVSQPGSQALARTV